MRKNTYQLENEADGLPLAITKYTLFLMKQTQEKSHETLEFKERNRRLFLSTLYKIQKMNGCYFQQVEMFVILF